MVEIIGVRFRTIGKIYYFSPNGLKIEKDTKVIVETVRGLEIGEAVIENREVPDKEITQPLKTVVRIATDVDIEQDKRNRKKEVEAERIFVDKITKHDLKMKLVDVEYTFDASKVLFYFTADGRVDFRDLVKDLASVFKTRIELRQIGVRDEAKTLGSYGICGRNLCCAGFLGEFMPVSIKMAKEQGLSLNPTKISGTCGRLMCCLKYEQDAYEDLIKITPKIGAIVNTKDGKGTVAHVSLLKGILKIRLDNAKDGSVLSEYKASEVKVIKDGYKVEVEEKIDADILKTLEEI